VSFGVAGPAEAPCSVHHGVAGPAEAPCSASFGVAKIRGIEILPRASTLQEVDMPTIRAGTSAGPRIQAGDTVIAASKTVSTKPVAKRFASFVKLHKAYKLADAKVEKATEALRKQQEKVGWLDSGQDGGVTELAGDLAGDGFPRLNPFASFGAPSPGALCKMGYGEEAKAILALEPAVLKHKGTSAASRKSAKKAGKLARQVIAALKGIPKLTARRTDAINGRDALEQAW
jgi:hypothetical protein